MANMQLLDEVMAFIEANPDKHDQSIWARHDSADHEPAPEANWCGTTACIAGWALLLSDQTLPWEKVRGIGGMTAGYGSNELGHRAAELLELSAVQREYLFSEARTLEEIKEAVETIRADPDASFGLSEAERAELYY